jgi:PAS domain S-box-containing protein
MDVATLGTFHEPPISLLTPNGKLQECNPAYLQMSGHSEEDLKGKSLELKQPALGGAGTGPA